MAREEDSRDRDEEEETPPRGARRQDASLIRKPAVEVMLRNRGFIAKEGDSCDQRLRYCKTK